MSPILPEGSIAAPTGYLFPAESFGGGYAAPRPRIRTRSRDGAIPRRWLNVGVALAALVLLAPLFLLIALAVKASSPGPVIFRQLRVGSRRPTGRNRVYDHEGADYGGDLFTLYKFRTMRAESPPGEVWARPDDDRVTPIGRFLRKYRLDELPQLVNVVLGDMNVVGPRPEQPKIVLSLQETVSGYADRHRVLPGITGWAQINLPYDRCIDDVQMKLRFDLEYIQRQSVKQDMAILLRTVPVVLLGKGAW